MILNLHSENASIASSIASSSLKIRVNPLLGMKRRLPSLSTGASLPPQGDWSGSLIPAGGSTTYKIKTVRDAVPGVPDGWSKFVSFTITIPNNDPDEDPYDFTIEFTAIK